MPNVEKPIGVPGTSARSVGEAHVVFMAQYLPIHFVTTMQALSRKVGRLTLLLSEKMDKHHDWTPEFRDLEIRVEPSLRIPVTHRHPSGFHDPGQVLVPCTTLWNLLRLRPDVVIASEVGPRTAQAALLRMTGSGFRLIIQVRESESTAAFRGPYRRVFRRLVLPRADLVLANGQSGRKHILDCGVKEKDIAIVTSGTDTEVFGHGAMLPRGDDELRLLYVGSLIPRKGVLGFARALIQVGGGSARKIRWVIAGTGPQEGELRAMSWPLNVQVEFLGGRPYRELPQVYGKADVFVMPSLADEWGMVVNEAMASGLPVLGCTACQAVAELVEHDVSGWIYDANNEEGLSRMLQRVLDTPLEVSTRMGIAARSTALLMSDEYCATAMAAAVQRVMTGKPNESRYDHL